MSAYADLAPSSGLLGRLPMLSIAASAAVVGVTACCKAAYSADGIPLANSSIAVLYDLPKHARDHKDLFVCCGPANEKSKFWCAGREK